MYMTEWYHLLLYLAIGWIMYIIFRNFQSMSVTTEGMTNKKSKSNNTENGMADNAAAYAASLKSATIKIQDMLLISKYRGDYESAILNLDDLIDSLMLKTALDVNQNDPMSSIEKLSKMQQAKVALNSVMKFVDRQ